MSTEKVADVIVTCGEFVYINIDKDFEIDEEAMAAGEDRTAEVELPATLVGFTARSRKAFELTKTKIQTSQGTASSNSEQTVGRRCNRACPRGTYKPLVINYNLPSPKRICRRQAKNFKLR